ncbi:MAG: methyltransferase domain-containing protein [Proteobacteria bacterium]|nr:methyltransferase domain-containing protein [Pseudomonadota bacterium]
MIEFDSKQYNKFKDQKNIANIDLIENIKHTNPLSIIDFGCGNGELSTATLANYFPKAQILAIDNNIDIINNAIAIDKVTFLKDTIEDYVPLKTYDLINFSGSMQWCQNHASIIGKYAQYAKNISIQMPDMFSEPFYTLIMETAKELDVFDKLNLRISPVLSNDNYIDICVKFSNDVKVWCQTYTHTIKGENSLLEWAKGAPLRPIFKLPTHQTEEFFQLYNLKLKKYYDYTDERGVLEFKRKFICLFDIQHPMKMD